MLPGLNQVRAAPACSWMPSCIRRWPGTPGCTLATSASPRPSPQSGWSCLNLAGGRVCTALGALTQLLLSPFPRTTPAFFFFLSSLNADKSALGWVPEDSTHICRVTLTLVPGRPLPLGAGTAFPVPFFPVLGSVHLILAPASPEDGHE